MNVYFRADSAPDFAEFDTSRSASEVRRFKGTTIHNNTRHLPDRKITGSDSLEGFPKDGRQDWRMAFSRDDKLPER